MLSEIKPIKHSLLLICFCAKNNEKIPEHLAKIEKERIWYMEFTLKELKHTSYQCGRYLEYAYHYYCPNEG